MRRMKTVDRTKSILRQSSIDPSHYKLIFLNPSEKLRVRCFGDLVALSDCESLRRTTCSSGDVTVKNLRRERLFELKLPDEIVIILELESNTLCDLSPRTNQDLLT